MVKSSAKTPNFGNRTEIFGGCEKKLFLSDISD